MSAYQFRHFAPMTGDVTFPYPLGVDAVARRARALLSHNERTDRDVDVAVDIARFLIHYLSDQLAEHAESARVTLAKDGADVGARYDLEAHEAYEGLPGLGLKKLHYALDECDYGPDSGFPNGRDYEYFAAWALYCLSVAIDEFDRPYVPPSTTSAQETVHEARSDGLLKGFRVSTALLEAIEAVHEAETLLRARRDSRPGAQSFEDSVPDVIEAAAKALISQQNTRNALAGRREDNRQRAEVFTWCEANLAEAKMSKKAAIKRLRESATFAVKDSTLERWIREFEAENRYSAR